MSEDFYKVFWRSIIAGVIGIVLIFTSCTMHANSLISDAINSGVDPLHAKVAFSSWTGYTELLIARLGVNTDDPK